MHVYAHSATLLLSLPVIVYINVVLPGAVASTSTGDCRCHKDCVGPPIYTHGPPTSFIAVTAGNFSRTTAAAECRSQGGRLAWITASNLDLRIAVSSGFKRYCNNCTFLWIGMEYNTFTKDFLWNTVDKSHVTCAAGMVPSSLSDLAHAATTEDCVGLEKLGNGTWAWKLANCADTVSVRAGTNNGYICEYKLACSAKWPDPPSILCTVLTTTTPVSTTTMLDQTHMSTVSNTTSTTSSTSVQATTSIVGTMKPKHTVAVGVIVGASVGSVVAIAVVAIPVFLLIKKGPNIAGSSKHRQIGVDESSKSRNSQSIDESRTTSKSQSIHIHVNA